MEQKTCEATVTFVKDYGDGNPKTYTNRCCLLVPHDGIKHFTPTLLLTVGGDIVTHDINGKDITGEWSSFCGMQIGRQTSGRCWKCNVRYIWQGAPRLKDAHCPKCGRELRATTHLFKGITNTQRPFEKVVVRIKGGRERCISS